MASNPFRYTEPVPPEDLVDRENEAAQLRELVIQGNNSRVVAPRRYGKTSLLGSIPPALPKGWVSVYVDFFGVLSVDDVSERIERAYAHQLKGRLASWFSGVRRHLKPIGRAGGGPVPAGVEVDLSGRAPLLDRLAVPQRLHERHGQRVFAVFDEFQDLLAADRRLDSVLRSEIQHHGDSASYVFAGSHVGMMRELFSDRRRAFYGQASPVGLGPLDDGDLGDYIGRRFEDTGKNAGTALTPLLDLVRGHPQRGMLAGHALWDATEPGGTATEETWDAAYRTILAETRDELRAVWTSLPTGQRRALASLARGASTPYGSQRPQGGSRGGAVRAALDALEARGELIVTDEGDRRIVDPLLAEWVRVGTPSADP